MSIGNDAHLFCLIKMQSVTAGGKYDLQILASYTRQARKSIWQSYSQAILLVVVPVNKLTKFMSLIVNRRFIERLTVASWVNNNVTYLSART